MIMKLWTALPVFIFFLAPAVSFAADQKLPAKPDVLFIAIGDLRDWVHYLGDVQAKSPNLDRLAARGLPFRRACFAAPVCNAFLAALMSARAPPTPGAC